MPVKVKSTKNNFRHLWTLLEHTSRHSITNKIKFNPLQKDTRLVSLYSNILKKRERIFKCGFTFNPPGIVPVQFKKKKSFRFPSPNWLSWLKQRSCVSIVN